MVIERLLVNSNSTGSIPLWIKIDQQNTLFSRSKIGRRVNSRGRLADAALLITDRDDLHGALGCGHCSTWNTSPIEQQTRHRLLRVYGLSIFKATRITGFGNVILHSCARPVDNHGSSTTGLRLAILNQIIMIIVLTSQ